MKVPFYSRCHGDTEKQYMLDCLSSDLETDGFFMSKILKYAEELFPGSLGLYTTSCTSALETALACIGLSHGDQVIIPSFNFPSAANAVLLHGGEPVLCDISPDTQNLSVKDAANRITSRTKALVAVHYAGVSCPMEELKDLAEEAGIVLIEDAAQGIGARYKDAPLGTIGDFGAVSFHHTKNVVCGEGGIMLTKHEEWYKYACQYRLHGTNRTMYLRGETDRYTWNIKGSCTALGEPAAAVLASQLEILERITLRRREIARQYREQLSVLEETGAARLMALPDYAYGNGHIFYLRFQSGELMEQVRKTLLAHEIDCRGHYVPLHMSPAGRKLGYMRDELKESTKCFQTLLRLPIHPGLSGSQVDYVSEMVRKACGLP